MWMESIVLFSLPVKGFLGTGATFEADLNLVVQFMMGIALAAGVLLARQQRYRAHGICQTTVLLLNLLTIGLVMWPSFRRQVSPRFSRVFHKAYYAVPVLHAALGRRLSSWESISSSWRAPMFFRHGCALETGSDGCERSSCFGSLL